MLLTAKACSIPAKCSPPFIAVRRWAACMCITASCRILNWNGSEMQPADFKELQEAIANAKSLEVLGNGTKRGMAKPVKAEGKLDLSRLNAITSYEPEELVFSALA